MRLTVQEALRRLNHPNIVTIYELGEVDGTSYISMELVEGEAVRELLDLARAKPGQISYGSGGVGTASGTGCA